MGGRLALRPKVDWLRMDRIKIGARFRRDLGDIEPLARSIAEVGLLHPPVVNERNELIAGHRRIEACRLLGWRTVPVVKLNLGDALRGQLDENVVRKDLTAEERVAIGMALEEREREKAASRKKATQIKGGKPPGSEKFTEPEKGEALEKVARAVGWSRPTYEKARAVVEAARSDPESYGDLVRTMEEVSVQAAYNELARRREMAGRKRAAGGTELRNLILGDALEEVPRIPDGSVDLLVVDPPYGETETGSSSRGRTARVRGDWDFAGQGGGGALQLLDALFRRAKPKLRPGAHVYVFTNWRSWSGLEGVAGKYFRIKNCLIVPYPRMSLGPRDTGYRRSYTMVMFAANGEGRRLNRPNQPDLIGGMEPPGFRFHPAEKSVGLLKYLISNSTVEGETVLDPMCGSGSALVAAEELGRGWIGIEIEPKWYEVAKARISELLEKRGGAGEWRSTRRSWITGARSTSSAGTRPGARGGLGGKGRPLRPLRGRFAEVGGRQGYHLTATDCL